MLRIGLEACRGWEMVASGLIDRVDVSHYRLSLHLVLAFVILSLIFWNYLEYKEIKVFGEKMNSRLPIIFLLLIFLQISIVFDRVIPFKQYCPVEVMISVFLIKNRLVELHVLINNIKKLNKKMFFIIQYRGFVLSQCLL